MLGDPIVGDSGLAARLHGLIVLTGADDPSSRRIESGLDSLAMSCITQAVVLPSGKHTI